MVRDGGEARTEYQRALMLYFLADWVTFEEQAVAENYHDLLRVSARIDGLSRYSTEKVQWAWPEGHIAVRLRYPDEKSSTDGGVPVVVLVQGNDTVKEALLYIEDVLVGNGFAVLNVDQAGWGESRIYDLGDSVRRLPAMQKRQVMKHWGRPRRGEANRRSRRTARRARRRPHVFSHAEG